MSRAIAATITVTNTASWGWITAWGLGVMPQSSVLNYAASNTLANTTVVPIVPGAGNDFSIYTFATTDVIIDVVGYYAAPEATAPGTILVMTTTSIAASSTFTVYSGTCSAGYAVTGGGYGWGNFQGVTDSEMTTNRPFPFDAGSVPTQWLCQGRNNMAIAQDMRCYAICSRVPGR